MFILYYIITCFFYLIIDLESLFEKLAWFNNIINSINFVTLYMKLQFRIELRPKKLKAGIEIFDKTYVYNPVFISAVAHTNFLFRKIVQLLSGWKLTPMLLSLSLWLKYTYSCISVFYTLNIAILINSHHWQRGICDVELDNCYCVLFSVQKTTASKGEEMGLFFSRLSCF